MADEVDSTQIADVGGVVEVLVEIEDLVAVYAVDVVVDKTDGVDECS